VKCYKKCKLEKNEKKSKKYDRIKPESVDVQGGPKNWTCLSVDNSAMVSGRKTCNTSKVSKWCKE